MDTRTAGAITSLLQVDGARQQEMAAHLGEGKLCFQTSAALRNTFSLERLRESTLKKNPELESLRQSRRYMRPRSGNSCDPVGTKLYRYSPLLWSISCVERKNVLHGQQCVLHIGEATTTLQASHSFALSFPRTCFGEDTPASPTGVDTTRRVPVTGYKSLLD